MSTRDIMTSVSVSFILIILSLLVSAAWAAFRCIRSLHLLQLDSYSNFRYIKWLWALPFKRLIEGRVAILILFILLIHLTFWRFDIANGPYLSLSAWIVAGTWLLLRSRGDNVKKPLAYTSRALRILIFATLLYLAALAGGFLYAEKKRALFQLPAQYWIGFVSLIVGLAVIQAAPLLVSVANMLLAPLQAAINRVYVQAARRRLNKISPLVVGITGSYGKTSTKYFLETILSGRFRVLKTPQSFNTYLGVCRVINNDLRSDHEVFIVEMGAYRRGDIEELSHLVRPSIGILTAIGPQHLERFKTIENIEATKYELVKALPESGVAVFNNDDQRCRRLADSTRGVKVLRYGLDTSNPGLRVWAEQIITEPDGVSFTIVDDQGNRETVRTTLLGRHNILNLLGVACVALEMKMTLSEIATLIPNIQAAPHRLQIIQGGTGVTVIDDSYNSNPVGAMEALNVLREFKGGRRVLVTPGMVELGQVEGSENERFGAHAAKTCDYVLLVGPNRTRDILRGLEREQFPPGKIRVVKDLNEATRELGRITRPGDIVLFENDLPDLYAEA